MRIAGEEIKSPNEVLIPIPRGHDKAIMFKARAVLSMDGFEKLCAEPKPPMRVKKGGVKEANLKDPTYLDAVQKYAMKRMAWMVLESLKATEELEWDTVNYQDPDTWLNWETELKNSGFSMFEIQRIQQGMLEANCLSETLVQAARDRFQLGTLEQPDQSSGPSTDQPSSESGKPAAG